MAPFRGRGSRGRGGRGGNSSRGTGRLARSGIKTKSGYRKFDSQRVKDVNDSDDEEKQVESDLKSDEGLGTSEEEDAVEDVKPTVKSYNVLLQSFEQSNSSGERSAKRRKVDSVKEPEPQHEDQEVEDALAEETENAQDGHDEAAELEYEGETTNTLDPFEIHFANPDDIELAHRLKDVQFGMWSTEKRVLGKDRTMTIMLPNSVQQGGHCETKVKTVDDLALKERIKRNLSESKGGMLSKELQRSIASHVFDYKDLLLCDRSLNNAESFRKMACLHSVNHVMKGRDKVIKNNERLMHAEIPETVEAQDQGFVRPKVLILLETRQMAANYADAIVAVFQPEQQENRKRFNDSFTGPLDDRETMPEDYRELFGGNNDNTFLTALKFTRKTLKFYSAFYNSDVIIASPLGLRRILENEDVKKRDYDFLSSIEVAIVDQADAMQMQNWENVEIVLKHLNLELKESHGADFSRVRPWYLDGNAKYFRQTIIFSGYLTPEMNRVFNTTMLNVAGKVKISPTYEGTITETSGADIKQTFSRFDAPSPASDPDARFKYFTTAILPSLLRIPKAQEGGQGVLIFIPSYFDFLRLRNYFATSDQTANISFGAIHDYSEVSEQRRARSHFLNGRHSFLLYTQRAHHFFRLRIRGAKRAVMYGVPDNPTFYKEVVTGFVANTLQEGKVSVGDAVVRVAFSKWDGLRLERVVGSERVKGMLGGVGDTFEFL